MTIDFLRVYRHFGTEAEKIFLGRVVCRGEEYFFEYNSQYLLTRPNPSPFLLRFSSGVQQEKNGRIPSFLLDSLPDGWGRLLMDREFRRQSIPIQAVTDIDRLCYVGDRAIGALSFDSENNNTATSEDILKFSDLPLLNKSAHDFYEEESTEILKSLNNISSSGGSRPKGNLFFSKDLTQCSENFQNDYEAWIVKFKTSSTLLSSEEGVCEYIYSLMSKNAGISTADFHLFELSDHSRLFSTKRFDRDGLRRIFSASIFGLIGADWREPSLDYEQIIRLCSALTKSHDQTKEVFRRMIFNLFSGNQDDHSKNWNFLQNDLGNWSLSPAFDTTYSPNRISEHSTSFKGYGKKPPKQTIAELARLSGEDKPHKTITEVLDSISQFPSLAKELAVEKSVQKEITKTLNDLYQQNKELLGNL